MIDLWLDDMRPAPEGWVHVKTVEEAKNYLASGQVRKMSLDHDLGACNVCMGGRTAEQWLDESKFTQMPNCDHFGTGYTLVCWMEETGYWSHEYPTVHSANPAGRDRMRLAIRREHERTRRWTKDTV